jgi:hypothetical protein
MLAGATSSLRRARGGGLHVVAFRNRDHDPRHSTRPVNLLSIVYASRFYGARRSCTPIGMPTTSTADFRTTRTAGACGCSWPGRSRGATRPWRTRRPAWSTWRHRRGGLYRVQWSPGRNRPHRRDGLHGICGATRATWRCRRDGIPGNSRAARRRRIRRTSRSQRRTRYSGTRGVSRAHRRHRRGGLHGICGAAGRRRIRRTSRSQRRSRRVGSCGASRAPG